MDNASPWNVSFSRTSFTSRMLSKHGNVDKLIRSKDIYFDFVRKEQGDQIKLLAADEYVFSLALVHRALDDFGEINIISVGGNWNGYSHQAKEYCTSHKIGLFNSTELNGAIWKTAYWDYVKKDEDGNRLYQFKRE